MPTSAGPVPPGTSANHKGKSGISSGTIIAIVVPITVAVLLFIVGICFFSKRTRNKFDSVREGKDVTDLTTLESLQFDFRTIDEATDHFSTSNKLGEGGFEDLLSYAWKLWKDGTSLEMLDSTLRGSINPNEVIRCIHVGLLCVQEDPADRPTTQTILLMLDSFSVTLPAPKEPAFFFHGGTEPISTSVNEMSISGIHPRLSMLIEVLTNMKYLCPSGLGDSHSC
ncbi:hypothetical protein L6164_032162 [Bauhinia variegata]|uniref:Uncharacterized protein n=1 Tax=Bauhinia variegata TaxID=167791 RepID=A0ACB9KMR6_BAUVA|nr:hypothetical protein L6164_032162 [Bauhinia variegata]